jgi:hypothetical protein
VAHATDEPQVQHPDPAAQEAALLANTQGKGYGPQSPRDLDSLTGSNTGSFTPAPGYRAMNLCNIHFHNPAEHRGGEFSNPDKRGGYRYVGSLSTTEATPLPAAVCSNVLVGDTIELHYVFSTAEVTPGPTLGACLNEALQNPQLRVEALVLLAVNDPAAADFKALTAIGERDGFQQALNIPEDQGIPIEYAGSTTGPQYNEKGSPLQVTWRVRPQVLRVNIASLGDWCQGNVFAEDHAHGVRNLIKAPELLSPMAPAQ